MPLDRNERERLVVGGMIAVMMLLWLGFLVHRSPRFPGSPAGALLGILAAGLLTVPLLYTVVKRIGPLKRWLTRLISMRSMLTIHIYAGILGPALALLHTGHKFQSRIGISLTALMLIVMLSGFVGRYLLSRVSQEISEKSQLLSKLESSFREAQEEFAAGQIPVGALSLASFFPRLTGTAAIDLPARVIQIADSIADVEYAIKTHAAFKRAFAIWHGLHIGLAFALYVLLTLHIWTEYQLGLRWWR